MKDIPCKPLGTYRHPNFKDVSGQRFGRLVAETYKGRTPLNISVWRCRCDCGSYSDVKAGNLQSGGTKSCGCFSVEKRTRHGMHGTPEYEIWKAMWQRCTNPKNKNFKTYEGRKPPESWREFSQFIKDMGRRPSDLHSIERVDNDAPYGPGNCKWELTQLQASNTKANRWLEHEGVRQTLSKWATHLGVVPATLRERLSKWPKDKALTTFKLKAGERHDKTNI